MHRTIEITIPPSYTDELIHELEQQAHVINLSVVRGASIKPPGDVLTVHALNRGTDEVMRLAEAAHEGGVSQSRRANYRASSIPSTSIRLPTTLMRRSGRKQRRACATRAE